MAKRRPGAPNKGTHRYAILDLFRRPARMPEPTGDKLMAILPKGITPTRDVAELARDAYQLRGAADVVAMAPREVAARLNLKGPSVRRDLAQLIADGELDRGDDGRYRLTAESDAGDLEDEDLARWEKWVRDAARDAGWSQARAENNGSPILVDGEPVIIQHSPNHGKGKSKPPPRGPSGGGGAPIKWGGRKLRASYDPKVGRDIAVLATPMRSIEILDDDRHGSFDALSVPPGAFAVAPTPNGRHWYRRWSARPGPWPYQDARYVSSSRERGDLYHERLFNDDGSRRAPPSPLPGATDKDQGLAKYMSSAWVAAQVAAEQRGMNRLPPRDRIPGEEG